MEHKKLYITILIIFIVVLCIGGTFALVATSNAINVTQIKTGNLTMTISGGDSEDVSFVPSTCTGGSAIKKTIVAKATNTSGGKVSFSIGLNIVALSDTYKKDTVKFALTTSSTSCTSNLIANGSFKNESAGNDLWLIKNDYDNIAKSGNTYTKTYYLYIWLDESETEYFDGNVSVKVKGTTSNNPYLTTEAKTEKTLLYDFIKDNADTTTTIDFSQTSETSSTNGIYMTTNTDTGEAVYYYRGNVDNHLIFANFCWRIVRTTETGGVKLIYDGVPSNGQCNNTGTATTIGNSAFNANSDDAKYVGYMYGSNIDDTENTDDSTIKAMIDAWYEESIVGTDFESQLEDTVFCNDRSYTASGSMLRFGAYTRLYTNKQPTLMCQESKDGFATSNYNQALIYPAGLITADEIMYAGATNEINKLFYLYTGQNYWTMSPYYRTYQQGRYFTQVAYLSSVGVLGGGVVGSNFGVRPVISLQPGTSISGAGTAESPFIIE